MNRNQNLEQCITWKRAKQIMFISVFAIKWIKNVVGIEGPFKKWKPITLGLIRKISKKQNGNEIRITVRDSLMVSDV